MQQCPTYCFEPVQQRHHDVPSAALLQVADVGRRGYPQEDAGQPRQDGELETLGEVGLVRVERLIGFLQRTR